MGGIYRLSERLESDTSAKNARLILSEVEGWAKPNRHLAPALLRLRSG
jgi:hypothetical protein